MMALTVKQMTKMSMGLRKMYANIHLCLYLELLQFHLFEAGNFKYMLLYRMVMNKLKLRALPQ